MAPTDPIRAVLRAQGRDLAWLARALGISVNYLHRILLPPTHPDMRPAPKDFYPRVSAILGVPECFLQPPASEPAEEAVA
jgi:hypothetical protein